MRWKHGIRVRERQSDAKWRKQEEHGERVPRKVPWQDQGENERRKKNR